MTGVEEMAAVGTEGHDADAALANPFDHRTRLRDLLVRDDDGVGARQQLRR